MKTLIADIYNRIVEFFQSEKQGNTSECATNRLQVILMHDRTKLDPLIMNKMREELIEVFSKYVVIDKEELEIGLKNEYSGKNTTEESIFFVIMHEFGHALGLGHGVEVDDVMFVPHQKNISIPSENDLYVLKHIYSN